MTDAPDPMTAPFGTLFADKMTTAVFDGDSYTYSGSVEPMENFSLHPATHALHYGSACFEGLKAHRQTDGSVAIFRLTDHMKRLQQTTGHLHLPTPDLDLACQMVIDSVAANVGSVPEPPGSLYIRPTVIGTEPNIGAAATPSKTALLYILNSPVGDYFAGGVRPLTLVVESTIPRTTPQFGMVKAGANYVMGLGVTLRAKSDHVADQVLFASGGSISETGAANFFLVDGDTLITRALDASFLHGVTRDSLLTMGRDLGYKVEERDITVDELTAWADHGEVFLSGTAAIVSPVGTIIVDGARVPIGDGQPGPNTLKLREALVAVQIGTADDPHGWRTKV